jgi:hypothetical protein
MAMGVSGPSMNGMQTTMAPQQVMNPGMMGAAGMAMTGGYGGMAQMSSAGGMGVPMMGPVGHFGGAVYGGMGGPGFGDMNQGMWNPAWQGGGP